VIEGPATAIAVLARARRLGAADGRARPAAAEAAPAGAVPAAGALVLQAVVAVVEMGEWGGSKGELTGYLVVSAVLVPGGLVLAVEERSRWGTLVLAVACLVVAVVQVRLLAVWDAGLSVGGGAAGG
jgi:hypothetical protein